MGEKWREEEGEDGGGGRKPVDGLGNTTDFEVEIDT